MIEKENKNNIWDLKFWLLCLAGYSAGYLLYKDRILPLQAIWNRDLLLLAGVFIFGVIYQFEFFVVSFWLFLGLSAIDVISAITPGTTGVSYWGGAVVWLLTLPAGFAGCVLSYLIPHGDKSTRSNVVRFR